MWKLQGLVLGLSLALSFAIPREGLYPFGEVHDDSRLQIGDDISSEEIKLQTPVSFYDDSFRSLYINSNGHVTFETDMPAYPPGRAIPFGFKMAAIFLADVDTTLSGNVYYRETRDPSFLDKASSEVRQHFSEWREFQPRSLVIITWDEVGYYRERNDKTNTFQMIIASDGRTTFIFFHYVDDGLAWIESEGKQAPLVEDIPAQAGFDPADPADGRRESRAYLLQGSGTANAIYFNRYSNVDIAGKYIFRVGNMRGEGIQVPDGERAPGDRGREPTSCRDGGAQTCHSDATCEDLRGGFCCSCNPGFFGNGRGCVKEGDPLRINGKLSGNLNGHTLNDIDVHSYVISGDGRAYTAIGHLAPSIGYSMQTLYTVGGILGWLFANNDDQPLAKNGYSITGGELERTATITFPAGGETVNIRQSFTENAQGYLVTQVDINGQIPNLANGTSVEVDDLEQEFRRAAPGTIKSYTRHRYRVDGIPYHLTVDQTLNYKECAARPDNDLDSLKLSVSRIHIGYQEAEQLVRYSMANSISLTGSDPCLDAALQCGPNSACVAYGSTAKCVCNDGYTLHSDGRTCLDEDECSLNKHDCHESARCYNTEGSFECRCFPGYVGDGRNCQRDRRCGDYNCDEHARCVYDPEVGQPRCECLTGYEGNGERCTVIEFSCNEVNNCHENADCVYDPDERVYKCECDDGYSGDGYTCNDFGEPGLNCRNCDQHAECAYDIDRLIFRCQCGVGYTGDGYMCAVIAESCDIVNNCHRDARCAYDPNTGRYRCVCNDGYSGNGYDCRASGCDVENNCHRDARCTYDQNAERYTCQCNPGFTGDGYRCETEGCNIVNDCDYNAECNYDHRVGRYVCQCREGYEGDGKTCTEEEYQCNVVNNCDINAECMSDPQTGSYYCRCRAGYTGDGYSCRLTADCRRDPGICDANARCDRRGTDFVCVCNPGFHGDGRRCAPEGLKDSYLMFAQGISILQVPFLPTDENPGKQTIYIPGQTAIGIDVDCFSRYFYWTDVAGKIISRAKLDGTDSQVLVKQLGSPEGVAVDWLGRNMYWTDSGVDKIEVSRLDGSNRKVLFDTEIFDARAIVVDPIRGYIFWTDWHRKAPKIERADMDGGNRMTLVSENLGLPNGITLDYANQRVCWADAGTMHIECVNYNGRGRQTIYALASYPFDLVLANDIFYWTDWDQKTLPNINQYGGTPNDPLTLPPGGNGRVYGISAVQECPSGSNACALNNGGCRFLCLPTPNRGRTCACPDDVGEDECNRVGLLIK